MRRCTWRTWYPSGGGHSGICSGTGTAAFGLAFALGTGSLAFAGASGPLAFAGSSGPLAFAAASGSLAFAAASGPLAFAAGERLLLLGGHFGPHSSSSLSLRYMGRRLDPSASLSSSSFFLPSFFALSFVFVFSFLSFTLSFVFVLSFLSFTLSFVL